MEGYQPKTEPYPYQVPALERVLSAPVYDGAQVFSLEMEQRTGKTKVIIDAAAILYERFVASRGEAGVNGLFVTAMPGRVHRNWVIQEIPAHLPDRIPRMCVVWDARGVSMFKHPQSGRWLLKGKLAAQLEALLAFDGLAVLAVNGEALVTPAFRRYFPRFLKARRRVMAAADEFTLIMKTPGIGRTRVMHWIGRQPQVVVKVMLDGTPDGEGPFDFYAPFMFLSWKIFGFTSYTTFRHHFAKWRKDINHGTGVEYETLDRGEDGTADPYMNLDELRAKRAPVSFRVLRKDAWGDAPEKSYQLHTYQLTPTQRDAYDRLEAEYEAELHDGSVVKAKHVLTRYLRLQQVCSNYWPPEKIGVICSGCAGDGCPACDDLGVVVGRTPLRRIDPKSNPRLAAALEAYSLNQMPTITWCRFQEDVDQVMQGLRGIGRTPVRYDGRCSNDEKDEAQHLFQSGMASDLVGNPTSGGRGLRLDRADLVVNYSNHFGLLVRLQGEDRPISKEKKVPVGIIDIVAEDTIDDRVIIPSLRAKKSVVDYVMGELGGKWL